MPVKTIDTKVSNKALLIQSPLLYTKPDGTQAFVHDTFRDYFFAKWLATDTANVDSFWEDKFTYTNLLEIGAPSQAPWYYTEHAVSYSYAFRVIKMLSNINNALLLYCSLVPDSTHFFEVGIRRAYELPDFTGPIKTALADLMSEASYVSQETVDDFVLSSLGSAVSNLSGEHVKISSLMNLILKKGRDPLYYFKKIHEGDEIQAIRATGGAYMKIGCWCDAMECFIQVVENVKEDFVAYKDYSNLADSVMLADRHKDLIERFGDEKAQKIMGHVTIFVPYKDAL